MSESLFEFQTGKFGAEPLAPDFFSFLDPAMAAKVPEEMLFQSANIIKNAFANQTAQVERFSKARTEVADAALKAAEAKLEASRQSYLDQRAAQEFNANVAGQNRVFEANQAQFERNYQFQIEQQKTQDLQNERNHQVQLEQNAIQRLRYDKEAKDAKDGADATNKALETAKYKQANEIIADSLSSLGSTLYDTRRLYNSLRAQPGADVNALNSMVSDADTHSNSIIEAGVLRLKRENRPQKEIDDFVTTATKIKESSLKNLAVPLAQQASGSGGGDDKLKMQTQAVAEALRIAKDGQKARLSLPPGMTIDDHADFLTKNFNAQVEILEKGNDAQKAIAPFVRNALLISPKMTAPTKALAVAHNKALQYLSKFAQDALTNAGPGKEEDARRLIDSKAEEILKTYQISDPSDQARFKTIVGIIKSGGVVPDEEQANSAVTAQGVREEFNRLEKSRNDAIGKANKDPALIDAANKQFANDYEKLKESFAAKKLNFGFFDALKETIEKSSDPTREVDVKFLTSIAAKKHYSSLAIDAGDRVHSKLISLQRAYSTAGETKNAKENFQTSVFNFVNTEIQRLETEKNLHTTSQDQKNILQNGIDSLKRTYLTKDGKSINTSTVDLFITRMNSVKQAEADAKLQTLTKDPPPRPGAFVNAYIAKHSSSLGTIEVPVTQIYGGLKATHFGYEKDPYLDPNSQKGIGVNYDPKKASDTKNYPRYEEMSKLRNHYSSDKSVPHYADVAFSPDVIQAVSKTIPGYDGPENKYYGAKYFKYTVRTSKGDVEFIGANADRTAENLRNRFDIYDPQETLRGQIGFTGSDPIVSVEAIDDSVTASWKSLTPDQILADYKARTQPTNGTPASPSSKPSFLKRLFSRVKDHAALDEPIKDVNGNDMDVAESVSVPDVSNLGALGREGVDAWGIAYKQAYKSVNKIPPEGIVESRKYFSAQDQLSTTAAFENTVFGAVALEQKPDPNVNLYRTPEEINSLVNKYTHLWQPIASSASPSLQQATISAFENKQAARLMRANGASKEEFGDRLLSSVNSIANAVAGDGLQKLDKDNKPIPVSEKQNKDTLAAALELALVDHTVDDPKAKQKIREQQLAINTLAGEVAINLKNKNPDAVATQILNRLKDSKTSPLFSLSSKKEPVVYAQASNFGINEVEAPTTLKQSILDFQKLPAQIDYMLNPGGYSGDARKERNDAIMQKINGMDDADFQQLLKQTLKKDPSDKDNQNAKLIHDNLLDVRKKTHSLPGAKRVIGDAEPIPAGQLNDNTLKFLAKLYKQFGGQVSFTPPQVTGLD